MKIAEDIFDRLKGAFGGKPSERKKKEAEERQKYVNWQMQRKRDRFVNKTVACGL